jgi:hypothetical protein
MIGRADAEGCRPVRAEMHAKPSPEPTAGSTLTPACVHTMFY